jgi:uncharacterized protein (DUF885 family)
MSSLLHILGLHTSERRFPSRIESFSDFPVSSHANETSDYRTDNVNNESNGLVSKEDVMADLAVVLAFSRKALKEQDKENYDLARDLYAEALEKFLDLLPGWFSRILC